MNHLVEIIVGALLLIPTLAATAVILASLSVHAAQVTPHDPRLADSSSRAAA